MTQEDWLNNELEALDRYELIALLIDYAEYAASGSLLNAKPPLEDLADFVDDWPKHS